MLHNRKQIDLYSYYSCMFKNRTEVLSRIFLRIQIHDSKKYDIVYLKIYIYDIYLFFSNETTNICIRFPTDSNIQ